MSQILYCKKFYLEFLQKKNILEPLDTAEKEWNLRKYYNWDILIWPFQAEWFIIIIITYQMENYSLDQIFMQYVQYCQQYSLLQWYCPPQPNFKYPFGQYIQTNNILKIDESHKQMIQVKKEQKAQIALVPRIQEDRELEIGRKMRKTPRGKSDDRNYFNKFQKEDRNLNSIVIRNYVNFVKKNPKIQKIIGGIIRNKKLNITAISYCNQFKNSFPPRQSYIGVGKLKNFIERGDQNSQIKLVTLILLRKFVDSDFFTVLFNSKKVSRSAKCKQLKHRRKFLEKFLAQIQ